LVQKTIQKDRFHDVTLLIEGLDGRFALMSKHNYPPGIFRSPSGGVEPGEDIAAGALREAREETGLNIHLKKFIAHISLTITFKGDSIPWDSYIFYATTQDRDLRPTDLKEVREAVWATVEEIREMAEKLRATRDGGLVYRGNLTDFSMWALRNELVLKCSDPSDFNSIENFLKRLNRTSEGQNEWWIARVGSETAALLARHPQTKTEKANLIFDPAFQDRGIEEALIDYVQDQTQTGPH